MHFLIQTFRIMDTRLLSYWPIEIAELDTSLLLMLQDVEVQSNITTK
jgi:hypothetical protein